MYANGLGEKLKAYAQEISLPLQKSIYKHNIKKYTNNIDVLITVSNYTLSNLANYTKIDNVVLQYEDTLPAVNPDEQTLKKYFGDYMLFVSGNRPEKNLARTIKAYKDYAQTNINAIPLYVVGTNKSVRNALSKSLSIQEEIENKQIIFFDYVSDEELAALYTNATFLVYTSKSEGFGLPALEAAKYGCPVMAAYGTSIPEVLGSSGKYINPYSTRSIKMGMDYMTDEAKRSYYKVRAKDVYMSILPKVRESNLLVIKTLLEDV